MPITLAILMALMSTVLLIGLTSPVAAQSDEELIANAMSAGPPAVAQNATIVAFDEKGELRTLRKGTNNFTCVADDPTPGNNPMCADENSMAWMMAWINQKEPPTGNVGFAYMLAGGATPSNVDPYATEPPGGGALAQEPPHVMIFNLLTMPKDYPRPDEDPDMSQPWVIWKDTPYEHLMIPVK